MTMLIGELAEQSGTTRRMLRYYEDVGLLTSRRDPNGYRVYDEDTTTRVSQIRTLLEAGFGTRTVGRLLPCARGPEAHLEICPTVAAEMRRVLDTLETDIARLDQQRGTVRALLSGEDARQDAVPVVPSQAGDMTTISRTFTVEPSPQTVIDYLKDFEHAEEWDPGTETCERIDSGPVAVGSRWHNVSKIAGITTELVYELKELTDDRIVLFGENETATSTDTITVTPHGSGSEVTYEADIVLKGAAKLGTPVVKLVFEKIGTDTEGDMTQVLNRL